MNTNESVVIMSAVRYMLGRSSYGVGSVIDHVKEKLPELDKSQKEVIIRDIEEHMRDLYEHKGVDRCKSEWMYLVNILKKSL